MTERKDKRVYNYRSALEQPTWIQKLSDKFTLPNAIKLSTIGWTAFLFLFYAWFASKLSYWTGIPLPFWFGLGAVPLWSLGILLSEFRIEEQKVGKFVRAYLKLYWQFGRRRKRQYLNDGLLYYKPSYILKKERRENGIKQRNL